MLLVDGRGELRSFAGRHGLKFVHIVLDRGLHASQPMVTLTGRGSAAELLWLATDMWPQGKDLYDAVLLAEHTTADTDLVRELMRPELGAEAEGFVAESVLAWDVDWDNFTDEHPTVTGTAEEWTMRLALALEKAWGQS